MRALRLLFDALILSVIAEFVFFVIIAVSFDCVLDAAKDGCSATSLLSSTLFGFEITNLFTFGLFTVFVFLLCLAVVYFSRKSES